MYYIIEIGVHAVLFVDIVVYWNSGVFKWTFVSVGALNRNATEITHRRVSFKQIQYVTVSPLYSVYFCGRCLFHIVTVKMGSLWQRIFICFSNKGISTTCVAFDDATPAHLSCFYWFICQGRWVTPGHRTRSGTPRTFLQRHPLLELNEECTA